jgi:hypothetical protein
MVRRYGALIGDLDAPSLEEYVQAIADRETYGGYIPKGQGWDKPALLVRFMHEVCNIPLWQARECAIIVIRTNGGHEVFLKLASHAAAEIAEECGNILVAEATASLYMEAAGKDMWWEDVLDFLRCGVPADEEIAANQGYMH